MSDLRAMTWRDIPRLAELEVELFGTDAWSPETWWSELAGRPRREYVVVEGAVVEGAGPAEIEGYAGLDHGGATADVMTLAVLPGRRGRGLGDLLVGTLLDRAWDGGADTVLLEVRADNAPAQALYRRHGFEPVSVRRGYYQPDGVDALVMRRRLVAEGEAP